MIRQGSNALQSIWRVNYADKVNDLIRSALALPAGLPWPPPHHVLLGLAEPAATPAAIEAAVAERMERLRAYQLAHPDEVTEAMNRLAQALIELTRPAVAAASAVAAPPPLELAPEPPTLFEDPAPLASPMPEVAAPVLDLLPDSFSATVEPPEPRRPFQEFRREAAPAEPLERQLPRQPLADARRASPMPPPLRPAGRSPRRAAIRAIVQMRRLLQAWDLAGRFLNQPEIIALPRTESIEVLIALQTIEAGNWPRQEHHTGGRILAFARSRPNLSALWELPHTAREILGNDWRNGRIRLAAEVQRLRQAGQRRRPARAWRRRWQRWRGMMPQAAVIVLCLTAGAVSLCRWLK